MSPREPTAPFVLVVDDEPSNLEFVARVLTESGYVVVTATEPREAVGVLDGFRFDLYVVDVGMPLMSGLELVDLIRKQDSDARVLYLTAFSGRLFTESNSLRDDEAFLEKPFTIRALREAVSRLLFGHLRGPTPGR